MLSCVAARFTPLAVLNLSLGLAGCGASDDPAEPDATVNGGTVNGGTAGAPAVEPSGGSTDPARPAPDNECGIDSGFEGDDLCILPPAPGEGIQLYVGPAEYDDPDALEPYLVAPGTEDVRCFNTLGPEEGFFYQRQSNRLRFGSHHLLVGLHPADGMSEGPDDGCEALGTLGAIPGSQTPSRDFPGQDLAPEDEGLARWMPGGAMAAFQLHYVNPTEEPLLREAWINLYRMEASEVSARLQGIFLVGDLALDIPPRTRHVTELSFTPELDEPVRIFELAGHSHAHSERFSVWRVRGGERDLLYESYDWAEPTVVRYNSVVENPLPNPETGVGGGTSGLVLLEPGDSLEWECEVNNLLDIPLRFANEAYTAEMCLLSGGYVGGEAGLLAGGCSGGTCFSLGGLRDR